MKPKPPDLRLKQKQRRNPLKRPKLLRQRSEEDSRKKSTNWLFRKLRQKMHLLLPKKPRHLPNHKVRSMKHKKLLRLLKMR